VSTLRHSALDAESKYLALGFTQVLYIFSADLLGGFCLAVAASATEYAIRNGHCKACKAGYGNLRSMLGEE